MAHRICPFWLGYFLLNPFRRYRENPSQILTPHVRPGMTVLDPGPGMGFFSLELARLVGPSGRVIVPGHAAPEGEVDPRWQAMPEPH